MGTSIAPARQGRWHAVQEQRLQRRLGLRPACYLDSDLLISMDGDEQYTGIGPQEAAIIVAELVDQFGGTYATEGQFTAEVSFLLGKLRAIREKEADHE